MARCFSIRSELKRGLASLVIGKCNCWQIVPIEVFVMFDLIQSDEMVRVQLTGLDTEPVEFVCWPELKPSDFDARQLDLRRT